MGAKLAIVAPESLQRNQRLSRAAAMHKAASEMFIGSWPHLAKQDVTGIEPYPITTVYTNYDSKLSLSGSAGHSMLYLAHIDGHPMPQVGLFSTQVVLGNKFCN